ncbi:hypothetical protein [Streptomyces sp. NPDC006477]|uniref:hypothetical protein n=1 Tax=Streptomyces sp. NPDC006477 TaxID=3364747 RepID=UPI0036A339F9
MWGEDERSRYARRVLAFKLALLGAVIGISLGSFTVVLIRNSEYKLACYTGGATALIAFYSQLAWLYMQGKMPDWLYHPDEESGNHDSPEAGHEVEEQDAG